MNKFCPLSMASEQLADCGDRCMLYNWDKGGCLIKKALETYIKSGEPIKMKTPTVEEMKKFIDMLEKTPAEPVLFKHPDLNIKHDYDEYGVDWYPHGCDDIAP